MEKSSIKQYNEKFKSIYGERYEPINYRGEKESIDIRCNTCGCTIRKPRAGNLIYNKYQSYICKECDTLYKQTANFKKRKQLILDETFSFIDEYQGKNIPIRIYHSVCDNVTFVNPDRFLDNFKNRHTKYCACCNPSNKFTSENFKNKLSKKTEGRLQLLGEYRSAKESISYLCLDCGNVSTGIADNVIRRLNCPVCNNLRGQYKQKSYKELFDKFFTEANKMEYQIIDDISIHNKASIKDKITVKHIGCGYSELISPYLLPDYSCKICNKIKWQNDMFKEFKKNVEDITNGEYEVQDGLYENNLSKLKIRHIMCNREFMMSKNGFITAGHRCPYCNSSKGERIVGEILKELGYRYLHNQTNPLCINPLSGKALELDFQIINRKKQVIAIIEYDGKQHFDYKDFFGASMPKEEWIKTVYRDNVRNVFSKEKKIPLLRIPYIYNSTETILPLLRCFLTNLLIPQEIYEYYRQYRFCQYR